MATKKKAPAKKAPPVTKKKAAAQLTDGEVAYRAGMATLGFGHADVVIDEDATGAVFTLKGTSCARLQRDGDEVVVSFLMPEAERGNASSLGYVVDDAQPGWLRRADQ